MPHMLTQEEKTPRENAIAALVDSDINRIKEDMLCDDWAVVAYNLETGFKGYANYTDEELAAEITERSSIQF